MLLKLRRRRRTRRFPSADSISLCAFNSLINKDIASHDTIPQTTRKLAADVHLLSVEKYGETTAVQKKVLIVDDSPAEIKLMQSLLEKEGYWPVVLDIVMPDRNGYQVCRDLKGNAEFNSIPVIMVTSKSSASDRFWGEQQGADGYVTKPFTRDELLRAVRRFV
jgi:CheY-like chemotaxis protein